MDNRMSPKYQIELVREITSKLSAEYFSNRTIRFYLEKWHKSWIEYTVYQENFAFIEDESRGVLDVEATLNTIDEETLIKIAIDLGIDTPDFIPSIPTFKNTLKTDYTTAIATFEKAVKEIEEYPDNAIGMANSALESIIKEIMKDERWRAKIKGKETTYALASSLLKEFRLTSNGDLPEEIKTIGTSLMAVSKAIEDLRSNKTHFHGKTQTDYVVKDPLYAYFVINAVTTVGLFLNSYYKQKLPRLDQPTTNVGTED